jgi:hypothetical protein
VVCRRRLSLRRDFDGGKKGVCVRYRVWVYSRDKRRWEAKERWRRRRNEEAGGCIKQQVADALWSWLNAA